MLSLEPTEWERPATRGTLSTGGGATVCKLSFALPWRPRPEAHDTLLDLFKHRWGDPRIREEDGRTPLVFRDEAPGGEIVEDTEHGAWKIEIRSTRG